MNFLAGEATDQGSKDEPFLGVDFPIIVTLLKDHRAVKQQVCEIKLDDFLRSKAQEYIDKVAAILLQLWPYMHQFESKELAQEAQLVPAAPVQKQ